MWRTVSSSLRIVALASASSAARWLIRMAPSAFTPPRYSDMYCTRAAGEVTCAREPRRSHIAASKRVSPHRHWVCRLRNEHVLQQWLQHVRLHSIHCEIPYGGVGSGRIRAAAQWRIKAQAHTAATGHTGGPHA